MPKSKKEYKVSPSKRMRKYVDNRAKGMDKKQSALKAKYAPSVATSAKAVIESKKSYEMLLQEYLPDSLILGALEDDIKGKPRYRQSELALAAKIKGMLSDKLDITSKGLAITFDNAFKPKDEVTESLVSDKTKKDD